MRAGLAFTECDDVLLGGLHGLGHLGVGQLHAGSLLGGAGGIESVFTILALRDQIVPPTINVENQDPACPVDCCPNTARKMPVKNAMKNSFGFGGTNSTIIYGLVD